jgi:hypothetical protein
MDPAHFAPPPAPPVVAPPRPGRNVAPRPRRRPRRWLLGVVLVFYLLGLGWGSLSEKIAARSAALESARRETAVRLVDEAARAARQGHLRDAFFALVRARHTDPRLPGLDIFLGEMLVNQGLNQSVGPIAWEALRRGEQESRANLLLGLEWWGRRGLDAHSVSLAAQHATRWITLAHEGDFFEGSRLIIRGEIKRWHGLTEEGSQDLTAGKVRLHPWHSAAVLEDKAQLAAAEAGRGMSVAFLGRFLPAPNTPSGAAAVQLRQALQSGNDTSASTQALRTVATTRQMDFLLKDRALVPRADTESKR